MSSGSHGYRIGAKISAMVQQAIVITHSRLVGAKHKLAMLVFRAISDEISEEVDETIGPILKEFAEQYDPDGKLAGLVDFMAHNHGQLKAVVGTGLSVSGLLWSISTIMNNYLSPLVYKAIGVDPQLLPDVGTIAGLAATGRISTDIANEALGFSGYGPRWQAPMIDSQAQYPSVPDALDLLRRGAISGDDFLTYAQKNGIPFDVALTMESLADVPVSPADAALALLRGNMSREAALQAAAAYGVSPPNFDILVGNTGEPLALMQLLEAKRRGFIDDATLVKGILQSRIRNEWIPTALKLAYEPISVADAVNAVVQNHLTMAQGEQIAQWNGLEAGWFSTLYQTAGEPLSRTEMEELYNRGLVTEADVDQALRESRLKDKYVADAFKLHVKLLEPRTLADAVQLNLISHADAVKAAMAYGYSERDATILVGEGSARKLQTYRDRVIAALETLYEDNAIGADTLKTDGKALGYDDAEMTYIAEAAEYKREAKVTAALVSAIRSRFLAHHIDEATASSYLDGIGIPATQRDQELGYWTIEAAANVKILTEAQVIKAVKLNLIPTDPDSVTAWVQAQNPQPAEADIPLDGQTRLTDMGYSEPDAKLLLQGA